jgi:ankyrin repeat protein
MFLFLYSESDDIFGYTRQNDLEKLSQAIKENADIINNKDEDGFTVLHLASDRGYLDIVKFLVDSGADLNIKTDDEETALHLGKLMKGRKERLSVNIQS